MEMPPLFLCIWITIIKIEFAKVTIYVWFTVNWLSSASALMMEDNCKNCSYKCRIV